MSDCSAALPSFLLARPAWLLVGLLVWVGCDSSVDRFPPNEIYSLTLAKSRSIQADDAAVDAATVVAELFGTPDQPRWPAELAKLGLVDSDRLVRAAGAVSSEEDGTHLGLYQEHCVVCHSLDGNGAGPASLYQNPHPRNFRHGVFKWKSTERSAKPTRDDLMTVLRRGLPGSAMPSFALVESSSAGGPDDLEALVDYAIYLSIRGEVERRIMAAAIDQLGYGDLSRDERLEEGLDLAATGQSEGASVVTEILARVAGQWNEAGSQVVPVPPAKPMDAAELAESIRRGDEIFHGKIANCQGCHGPGGNGVATVLDYDDWGKEYSTMLGLTPSDRDDMRPFRKVGALAPRPIEPRNLTSGVYRGGGDGETLYRRIAQGIAGTPMPGVQIVPQENGLGLTSDQVWDLVHYLQSLGTDPSEPGEGRSSP